MFSLSWLNPIGLGLIGPSLLDHWITPWMKDLVHWLAPSSGPLDGFLDEGSGPLVSAWIWTTGWLSGWKIWTVAQRLNLDHRWWHLTSGPLDGTLDDDVLIWTIRWHLDLDHWLWFTAFGPMDHQDLRGRCEKEVDTPFSLAPHHDGMHLLAHASSWWGVWMGCIPLWCIPPSLINKEVPWGSKDHPRKSLSFSLPYPFFLTSLSLLS